MQQYQYTVEDSDGEPVPGAVTVELLQPLVIIGAVPPIASKFQRNPFTDTLAIGFRRHPYNDVVGMFIQQFAASTGGTYYWLSTVVLQLEVYDATDDIFYANADVLTH